MLYFLLLIIFAILTSRVLEKSTKPRFCFLFVCEGTAGVWSNVCLLHPRGLPMCSSATSCSALLVYRSTALVISLSQPLSHHILQVEACLEPKGYLLFLLKECWLFNLCCCAALALLPFSSSLLLRSYINFPTSIHCLCLVIKWPIAITHVVTFRVGDRR